MMTIQGNWQGSGGGGRGRVQARVHRSERKVGDKGGRGRRGLKGVVVDGGSGGRGRGSGGGGGGGGGGSSSSRGVYASVGGQPRGEMSRGWYKLYRSIDLLSEDPPLAARKLMLLLLLPLPALRCYCRCCYHRQRRCDVAARGCV